GVGATAAGVDPGSGRTWTNRRRARRGRRRQVAVVPRVQGARAIRQRSGAGDIFGIAWKSLRLFAADRAVEELLPDSAPGPRAQLPREGYRQGLDARSHARGTAAIRALPARHQRARFG